MEFGMFHEFPSLPGLSQGEAFAQGFAQVEAAERLGLDAMWLAELHFAPERSVLSAPLGVANAIAARTSRIRIGIAVQVLPLCHPLRLAEEAATVDQISRGRLIFGIGRSGVVRTYEDYGIPYSESRERFAEAFEIIKGAWTEPGFSYEGRYHSCKDVNLVPLPWQQPHPPVRIAASSAETFPQIGRAGYPIFVAVRHGTFSELIPSIQAYREAWRAAGHKGRGEVYLRVPAYLAETDARAYDEPRDSLMHFYQRQAALAVDSARRSGGAAAEQRIRRAERLMNLSYDEAVRGQVLLGSPDTFSERLRAVEAELGLDGILAELNPGGRLPHERVLNALRLLCEEVKPRVH